ncbi:hypothetical protein AAFP35_25860 [Gordonia sp. CPCC 206044]|uniref:hypothetical protein n=1 Tax=Gordonia sp. CPCC 206044 TaxID=3140793 RepID=UPI003AF349C5
MRAALTRTGTTTTTLGGASRKRLRSTAVGLAIAGAAGAGLVSAAPASAAVTPIGVINGHPAFAIGPHASSGGCGDTANRLSRYGAKKFGAKFATCYRAGNGSWYAISPWEA